MGMKPNLEDYRICPECTQPIINRKGLIKKNPTTDNPVMCGPQSNVNWALATELYHRNWKMTAIAELFGVSVAAISRKFRTLGLSDPKRQLWARKAKRFESVYYPEP